MSGTWHRKILCGDCHTVPSSDAAPGRIDGDNKAEVFFADIAGQTAAWNGTTCTTRCHGQTAWGGTRNTPTWTTVDGSQSTCGSCHGTPPPAPHPAVTNMNCAAPVLEQRLPQHETVVAARLVRVRQLSLVIAMVALAACASKKKDAAPAPTAGEGGSPAADQPAPVVGRAPQDPASTGQAPAALPPPPPGGPDGSRQQAIDQTRQGGLLGPSAPTSAFDPIDADPNAPRAKAPALQPKGGGGGDLPTYGAHVGAVTFADGKPAEPLLARALKVRVADVQACYEKTRVKKPTLTGTLKLTFTVSKTGALTAVTVVSSDLKDIELESCVINVVQTTRVKASDAESKSVVTIKFTKDR